MTYVLVAVAAQMFAGVADTGLGLGNPETADNVFAALAEPVLGSTVGLVLLLAVLGSSASSLQTTFIPAARTMPAMSVYEALPKKLSEINPHYGIPSYATLISGIGTAVFYTVMSLVSENVLVLARPDDLLLLRADGVRRDVLLPARPDARREVVHPEGRRTASRWPQARHAPLVVDD